MQKILAAFLIICTCLFLSCKSISVSEYGNESLTQQDNKVAQSLPPSKSGQFLAARQALFNGTMLRLGSILTKLYLKVLII